MPINGKLKTGLILSMVLLFCSIPWLIHGYTLPAGDDLNRLALQLDKGIYNYRYYGHLPLLILPTGLYYYSTPLINWLGLKLTKQPIQIWLATWWVLPIGTFALMKAASPLALINFLTIAPIIFLILRAPQDRLRQNHRLPKIIPLLFFSLFFHTSSGTTIIAGTLTYLVLSNDYPQLKGIYSYYFSMVIPLVILTLIPFAPDNYRSLTYILVVGAAGIGGLLARLHWKWTLALTVTTTPTLIIWSGIGAHTWP